METLEFEPLGSKRLTVLFVKKSKEPNEDELSSLKDIIKTYPPEFAAEELGERTIDDFYKMDQYARLFQEEGVMIYPVDISDYAKLSISAITLEKRRLAEMTEASCKDKANAEYVKAYASVLRDEYESMRREEEISIRNDWMVKGILESAHRFVKKDIICLFIGDKKHWRGMKETLNSLGAETHEVSALGGIKKFMEKHAEIISGS
ncbi:MAG: hypothetical protein SVY15_08235 [Halobacteriota archaeon]|nr:hypothetical protein [Halobacteriota archaeon]